MLPRVIGLIAMVTCLSITTTSAYCETSKPRETCSLNGRLLWRDTRMVMTQGQFGYHVQTHGPQPAPPCSCIDLREACLRDARQDCDEMDRECTKVIGSGGQFCLPNRWNGTTCYK